MFGAGVMHVKEDKIMSGIPMNAVDDVTIGEVLAARARTDPDHVLCRCAGADWNFTAVNAAVNRVANGLRASGLQPGDRVALMLPAHPHHIIAILALAKARLVRVPVNVSLIGAALAYPFEAFAIDALIADAAYAEALGPVLSEHSLRRVFWRGGSGESFEALTSFDDAREPPDGPAPDDIIAITPSSGTTGAPKGVLKSDRTLRAGPLAMLRLTEVQPGETLLFWEALHHGAGVAVLIAAILNRLTLAMVDRFSASRFWAQAAAARASRVHYLGSVLSMVLRQPPGPDDRSHGVTIAWGGGCPAELWEPVQTRFGVHIREGYGLSELITFVTLNIEGRVGSVGKPLSWFDAAVMTEDGTPCPPGVPGELCLRAHDPRLGFLGYFRNEAASAAAMRDGWFRTGDLAHQDADGFFYFSGRVKDAVRRRGINISAWEVERVVIEHPDIAEVAMIGVPSALGEDDIKLFIRLADGAALAPAALLEWCSLRLPKFQMPRYIAVVGDFPRTPTQRIRKLELSRDTQCWDAEAA
jgi:crotonobetaine/carnitine-CoA ligase